MSKRGRRFATRAFALPVRTAAYLQVSPNRIGELLRIP